MVKSPLSTQFGGADCTGADWGTGATITGAATTGGGT